MSDDAPTLRLELASRPENLTLVRGMLGGLSESLAIDPELLDDLKTAVSEACNNVVIHAYAGEPGPLSVDLHASPAALEVIVRDRGRGISYLAPVDDRMQGIGLPVIQALTQQAEFRRGESGGTEVRMLFAARRNGQPLFECPDAPAPDHAWVSELSGDAVVSLSPLALLTGVLGRLARTLAASSRFSLDRFSDVYLVTDAISAHAQRAANGGRIGFALRSGQRRLELTLGPFAAGSGAGLEADEAGGRSTSPLRHLIDELAREERDGAELLRVVMLDHRR